VSSIGPLGVAFLPGNGDGSRARFDNDGSIYRLPTHANGQVTGASLSSPAGSPRAFAQVFSGGVYHFYLARASANNVVEINPTTGGIVGPPVATINGALQLVPFPGPPLAP